MVWLTILLRLIHIFAGVLWAGGALFMGFIIGPSIKGSGTTGQQFAGHLFTKARLSTFMTAMALSTVLAGAILYLVDSKVFTSAWMTSGPGIGFGLGSLAGLVAFVFGFMFGKTNEALIKVGSQIQGQPTPEQTAQIQAIQKRLGEVSKIHITAMILAVILMAIARYFQF